jgi:hypothetical protein
MARMAALKGAELLVLSGIDQQWIGVEPGSNPPGPPNKPLIFLEKVRFFSLSVEKVSNLSLLEKVAFEV